MRSLKVGGQIAVTDWLRAHEEEARKYNGPQLARMVSDELGLDVSESSVNKIRKYLGFMPERAPRKPKEGLAGQAELIQKLDGLLEELASIRRGVEDLETRVTELESNRQ